MFSNLRGLAAALVICALLAAAPSSADSFSSNRSVEARAVPVIFDALFLRPIGLVMTISGAVVYGVSVPFVAMTRPTDLGTPLEPLVLKPARYTFVDPIGQH
jgi:hypothetical protein